MVLSKGMDVESFDVESFDTSCVSSSSLLGNDAPVAFAKVIHQGERSKALPNAPNEPTGPSAAAAAQFLCDDDDVDDDDDIYKRNDESRFDVPVKQPPSCLCFD